MWYTCFFFFVNNKFISRRTTNIAVQNIECLWTVFPIFFLVGLVGPSLSLLYISDEKSKQFLVLKCIGHQWYWSYESPIQSSFDRYITKECPLYFDTDNSPILPVSCPVRYATTSVDVLHRWTVPGLGIKIDAVPGRLNTNEITALNSGVFYGQCSEICGVNHSFIPIRVEFC